MFELVLLEVCECDGVNFGKLCFDLDFVFILLLLIFYENVVECGLIIWVCFLFFMML